MQMSVYCPIFTILCSPGDHDVRAGAAGEDTRPRHGDTAGGRKPQGQLRGREQPRAEGPRRHGGVLPRGQGRAVGDLQAGPDAPEGPGQALQHPPGVAAHSEPQDCVWGPEVRSGSVTMAT